MRKMKKLFTLLLTAAISVASLGAVTVAADDDVKPRKVKITQTTKTMYVGATTELKAKMSPSNADDDYLRWTIVGTKGIVKFDDDDRDDDEIEIKALKAGETKIRCHIKGTSQKSYITIKVKNPTYDFSAVGKTKRTVEAGDDFELKVKKTSGLKERHLKWSIKNTKIVRFDDDDRYGSEIELEGRRAGTTTVTCTNSKTKKTITYTIKVVPDNDDDDD